MSSPDGKVCGECPICRRPTTADELWDCGGLCMRCDNEQQEVMADNRTVDANKTIEEIEEEDGE